MSTLFPTPKPQAADPRDKRCATCQGPHAHCGIAGMWFCLRCVPADYWPQRDDDA
jgi:hypothetical protein